MNRGFLTTINGGVAKIHGNQQELELRAGELQQQSAQFAKQTAQWLQAVEKFNATYQVCATGFLKKRHVGYPTIEQHRATCVPSISCFPRRFYY